MCCINGGKHEVYILRYLRLTMANIGTMVRVRNNTKKDLEDLKIIKEEPIDKVVRRLIEEHKRALEESA